MGLREVFRKGAVAGMAAFGDVKKDCRYISNVSTTHNISAGTISTIGRSYFVSMLFETYSQTEIENTHIEPTDVKAYIAQEDLPPLPSINDNVVNMREAYGSTEYEVLSVNTDPADAMWVFQLRAVGKRQS